MISHLRSALVLTLVMTALTGIAYPFAVTGIAELAFPRQAHGSLIERDGKVVGSALIGQAFSGPGYFHGRPSAAGQGYDAANSGGSNLAPSARALAEAVRARIAAERAANPGERGPVPADLVTASASGLDPHLSPAAAAWQAARVALARGLAVEEVRALIAARTEGRTFGLLGEPRVNVLALNLALDERRPMR
ncbi:potassium-transporting ATPase subunit KdpC [Oleispirillum naphthae]|uniref:potassium-transporting ATPase subunit KdpC n=1 Tax=Oleispirillum naphthae TaxID=2838853 RepID=UPI003082479F